MKYRPEIDGLRTIAVVPVIIYHAGFHIFPGGFLGVDVFFVISGYLITLIISQEINEKKFSIMDFYERRARRILPALFAVLAVTTLASWLILYPADFKSYGQSLFATAIFSSNIYFYITSDYFSPAAESLPLVHTWSLAVEEQFYIFFPLLLIVLSRLNGKVVFIMTLILCTLSLILAQFTISQDASAAFYLLPTRAWELGCGALAALVVLNQERPRSPVASALGLTMILVAMVFFDTSVPTPSMWTAIPVIGATLIVLCGEKNDIVGRVLSARPMVAIGLVSYSAYLWHQPLMALVRHKYGIEPPIFVMLVLIGLTFVLAGLSWKFVEQPFRRRGEGLFSTRPEILAASAVGLTVCLAIGLSLHLTKGLPSRIDDEVSTILTASKDFSPKTRTCLVTIDAQAVLPNLAPDDCRWAAEIPESKGLVVLVGDSHANALAGVLSDALSSAGYDFQQMTVRGCAPFPGFRKDRSNRNCHTANLAIESAVRDLNPDRIIVSWRGTSMYAEQFDNGEGGIDHQAYAGMDLQTDFYPDLIEEDQETKAIEVFRRGLDRWADIAPLIVLGPIPEAGWNVPITYARFRELHQAQSLSTKRSLFEERNAGTIGLVSELKENGSADVLFPHEYLCGADRCMNAQGDKIYYSDDDHLTNTGAALIVPEIISLLEGKVEGS